MKNFYDIYTNGMVQLVLNLPSKNHAYAIRNHEWIDVWDDLKHRTSEILGENLDDRDIDETEIHITDPEFVKAVEHTQMFSSQCKDQVSILYVPFKMLESTKTTRMFNTEE